MTASTASTSAWVLPGQPLPSAPSTSSSVVAASGSYARSDFIFSSSTGQPSYTQPAPKKKSSSSTGVPIQANVSTPLRPLLRLPEPESIVLARVTRITSRQAMCSILLVLPDPGASGTATSAMALNLSQSLASGAANHAAGEDPSGLDFSGVIRQQDVRLTETDKVKMAECFRVGDLVKAKVVSLGDTRSYFLTTASNELGVIFATAALSSDTLPSSNASLLPSSLTFTAGSAKRDEVEAGQIPGALKPVNWQEMKDPTTGKREKRKVAKPDGV